MAATNLHVQALHIQAMHMFFISRGDIAMPPVRPSVTFSFRTVTQKRIDVFSRNFAGTCTMSWGVLYSF